MKRAALAVALLGAIAHASVQTQTRIGTTSTTPAQTSPTQAESVERAAAQHWNLTLDDYRRYQALMKGVRGALSDPRISPIEVLGIHARDDAERRRYAELFARLMAEDTQRVLLFQAEYERAYRRLHPRLAALDFGSGARLPPGAQTAPAAAPVPQLLAGAAPALAGGMSVASAVVPGDRLLVFAGDGCRECDDLVQRATVRAGQGVTVDLYVVGARSGDDAQRYARRLALDPALIESQRVTLNVDAGTLARVLPQQPGLPALVRKRGQSLVQLAASEL